MRNTGWRRLRWPLAALLVAVVAAAVVALVVALVVQHRPSGRHAAVGTPTATVTVPAPTTSAAVSTAPEPTVVGNTIVDQRSGLTLVPRGVDWSSFEYACTQGWGYSALDTLGAGAPDSVAAALRSWGINTVRLPLNEDCWLGTRGAPVSDATVTRTAAGYRQAVHAFVTALNAHGIVAILDLQSRKLLDADNFGNFAMPDSDALTFWRQLAAEYRQNRSVLFDAFNEPYSRTGTSAPGTFTLTWQCWRDGGCQVPDVDDTTAVDGQTYPAVGMAAIVAAIRAAGATQPILLGGLAYANDLSQWLAYAPADRQLIAAFHTYDFTACSTQSCWDTSIAALHQTVPVLTSELGANKPLDGYVGKYLDWAHSHDIGVLFWVWGNNDSSAMALTTDEYGDPTQYGVLARNWLRSS